MSRNKVNISTGTAEEFFRRIRSHAAKLDRGETIEEHGHVLEMKIAAFNKELAGRLVSLDRGERVDPKIARKRMEQKLRDHNS